MLPCLPSYKNTQSLKKPQPNLTWFTYANICEASPYPEVLADGLSEAHGHNDDAVLPPHEVGVDEPLDGGQVHWVFWD